MLQRFRDGVGSFVRDPRETSHHRRYHEREDRSRRLKAWVLSLLTIAAALYYFWWLIPVLNWSIWLLTLLFLLAEVAALFLFAGHTVAVWFLRLHRNEGLPTDGDWTVDVFIPAYDEPMEVLQPTLEAAVRIDYPRKQVYLLDDGNRPERRALAERLGIDYSARPTHEDAKAGNLNYAFARTQGDLILTLDADQVPDPRILRALTGYFRLPYIAFVQSLQRFTVPKDDPFGNLDPIFYNVVQLGRDADVAAISCGSGVVYRRSALREIGGFSAWNLVEDLHTSMRLHATGWRSVYHHYPLSVGTAPSDILGNYQQRLKWATDGLRIFFWDNPFFRKGLSLKQKIQYAQIGFYYLVTGFLLPVFFLVPIWTLFTGDFVIVGPPWTYIVYRLPYFFLAVAANRYASNHVDPIKTYQAQVGYFPIFIRSTFRALRSRTRKAPNQVTVKKHVEHRTGKKLLALAPQLAIILLTFGAIGYRLVVDELDPVLVWINIFWGLWSVLVLHGIVKAAFLEKQVEPSKPAPQPAEGSTPLP